MLHSLFVHALPLRVSPPSRAPGLFCAPKRYTNHASLSVDARGSSATAPSHLLYAMRHTRALMRGSLECALRQCESRVAIDATCGRGSDTITLGKILGPSGVVHAVDIQEAAIEETRSRYAAEAASGDLARLETHSQSHDNLRTLNTPLVMAVVYNLGWYPGHGADPQLITGKSSTISSLGEARHLVAPGGIIVVTAYVGHAGGEEEAQAVFNWASGLPNNEWSCTLTQYPNRKTAPTVHVCERLG